MNKLNAANEKLDNRVKQLQREILKHESEAKELLRKSKQSKGSTRDMYKNKCLMVLKKKKQLDQQLKAAMSQQLMIQNAQMTSENVNGHKQMMQNMQYAIGEQKEAMKNVDIDKMEELKDQMLDMKFESDYMNEMMNRQYDDGLDEEDFEDDFAEFEREVAKEKKKVNIGAQQQQQQQNSYPAQNNANNYNFNRM